MIIILILVSLSVIALPFIVFYLTFQRNCVEIDHDNMMISGFRGTNLISWRYFSYDMSIDEIKKLKREVENELNDAIKKANYVNKKIKINR